MPPACTTVSRRSSAGSGDAVRVSLFIDADAAQIDAARALGVPDIELHTGAYAEAVLKGDKDEIGHRHRGACARARGGRPRSASRSMRDTA